MNKKFSSGQTDSVAGITGYKTHSFLY